MPNDSSEVLLDLQKSIDGLSDAPKLSEEDIRKLHDLVRQKDLILQKFNEYLLRVTKSAPAQDVKPQTTQPETTPVVGVGQKLAEAEKDLEDAYLL